MLFRFRRPLATCHDMSLRYARCASARARRLRLRAMFYAAVVDAVVDVTLRSAALSEMMSAFYCRYICYIIDDERGAATRSI